MTYDELAALIARLSVARIRFCEYKTDEMEIRVLFDGARHDIIHSRETGVFHSRHPLAKTASPRDGEVVAKGQILAYVRTGGVMRPVTAPLEGRIRKQLLTDGAAAGYGDPLYLFEAAAGEMKKP